MKLIKCHIVGFGKIHDCKYDFKDGLNVFCEENGFGKSTLASFVKVMLYGFEDENKKSLKDKEREKFRPWDRSSYGGSITFEFDGKTYEVSRIFGKNTGDDSFEVRSLPGNEICNDFDKESLGLKIFGIDKDSFFRTIYIASSDLGKKNENVTDSIRAKLGNLTDATDDINNYETACVRFEKKMNEYSPDRKPGKIKMLNLDIAEKSNAVRNLENTEKATEILEEQISAQLERINSDKERIKELKKEESRVMKAEAIKAKQIMHTRLSVDYENSRKQCEEIKNRFGGNVPTLNEINAVGDKVSDMKHIVGEMEENLYPKDEKWEKIESRFENGVCSEEEIKKYISVWNETQNKKTDIKAKENRLKEEAEGFIREQKEITAENYQKGLETYRKNERKRITKLVIFGILAFLSLAGAAALTVMGMMGIRNGFFLYPEVILFVIAVVFILLIFAMKLPFKKRFTLSEDVDISIEDAKDRVDRNSIMRNSISSGKSEVMLIDSQVRNFLEKYKAPFVEEKVVETLLEILEDVKEYSIGKKKIENYEKAKAEYEKNVAEVDTFFKNCNIDPKKEIETQLKEFQELSVKYIQFSEETEKKKVILEQFESENDIKELSMNLPDSLPDADDLRDEAEELSEEIEKETEMLNGFRRRLEERQEERENLENLAAQLEEEKETLKKHENDYRLMKKAFEYLGKAKNELALKYTGPTMEGFKKYCSFFGEEDSETFNIDTNLNLTKTEEGMQRRISDLSLGLKEVTDFCLRMGLIDAMYDREKPFIILDDPFVNYDSSNLSGASNILKKIAADYQILYFTCHESRKPEL
ncbi:MAG: AAA family ATPase [Lachnospiraceae bacterium]|nr:AAA family ATPase [Lachnospiraceae bacterium]